ncbi:dual specificity protein kinase splA-like [Musca domestica]|uniref:Dual specificity protein kinase splA-like n=1 Tax=Musca domestica TaxID=7370 RepID=A0ABM3URZ1_MUSDO|nr:dual specificity protein kinase splA-like [Musca domestica]
MALPAQNQAQALNVALNNQQGRSGRGKVPPPLLRSRTLPAIIVPGIPVVSLHTDKSQFQWEERLSSARASTCSGNRWSLLTRNTTTTTATSTPTSAACSSAPWNNNNNSSISNNNNNISSNFNNNNNTLSIKSLNLPKDDGTLVYRRKSSGSTPHGSSGAVLVEAAIAGGSGGTTGNYSNSAAGGGGGGAGAQTPDASMPYRASTSSSTADDFECYAADGSVLLRRKDSSALQRSASIDSFAEVVWSDSPRPSLEIPRPVVAPFSKRPSASSLYSNCSASSQSAQLNINELCVGGSGGGGAGSCGMTSGAGLGSSGNIGVGGAMVGITTSANNRRESLLSPSSTRRNKLTRIINGKSEEMLDLKRNLCGEKVCSLVMKGKENSMKSEGDGKW